MNPKNFYSTVSSIFSIIAILHLLRIISGWQAVIGGLTIPMWASWVAVVVAGYLAYTSFNFYRKS